MKRTACLLLLFLVLALCRAAARADTLAPGASGEAVTRLQQRLITLGYLDDIADGIYGDSTREAVNRLRATLGLGDGDADDAVRQSLFSDAFTGIASGIAENEQSFDAKRVQRRLCALGYLSGHPDGIFGASSMKAVRIFRLQCSLPAEGGADADALSLLFSDGAVPASRAALYLDDDGDAVSALQKKLILAGFWDGFADGYYGEDTSKGVKNLQTYLNKTDAAYAAVSAGKSDGQADPLLLDAFLADSFSAAPAASSKNDEGMEVRRLQTRLMALGYLAATPDGGYGTDTQKAVAAFQTRNELKKTGAANAKTLALLHSDAARAARKPYRIVVKTAEQKLYVYEAGADEKYANVAHTFVCSTGAAATPTYAGTYETAYPFAEKQTWADTGKTAYYLFAVRKRLYIRSVLYDADGQPNRESVAGLGRAVTTGDIVLSVPDAQWIYEKCPKGTPITVE